MRTYQLVDSLSLNVNKNVLPFIMNVQTYTAFTTVQPISINVKTPNTDTIINNGCTP